MSEYGRYKLHIAKSDEDLDVEHKVVRDVLDYLDGLKTLEGGKLCCLDDMIRDEEVMQDIVDSLVEIVRQRLDHEKSASSEAGKE